MVLVRDGEEIEHGGDTEGDEAGSAFHSIQKVKEDVTRIKPSET